MPRSCSACSSPNRKAIDAALAMGEPLRKISERVSISITALFRHKEHVSKAIVKIAEKREESIGERVTVRLEELHQRAMRVLDEAEASGDGRLALQAIREVRETQAGIFTLAMKSVETGGVTFVVPDILPRDESRGLKPGDQLCDRCHGSGKIRQGGPAVNPPADKPNKPTLIPSWNVQKNADGEVIGKHLEYRPLVKDEQ